MSLGDSRSRTWKAILTFVSGDIEHALPAGYGLVVHALLVVKNAQLPVETPVVSFVAVSILTKYFNRLLVLSRMVEKLVHELIERINLLCQQVFLFALLHPAHGVQEPGVAEMCV